MKSFQYLFSTLVYSVKTLFLLLFAFLALNACKEEDKDEEKPKVFIESPFENESFLTVDTIEVFARISDNEQLKEVSMEILDQEFNQVLPKRSISVSGSSVDFLYDLPLNGTFLPSGLYYLAVRANDGSNVGSGFKQVSLTAIPRELEGFVVVTANSTFGKVLTSENFSDWTTRLEFNKDIRGVAFNYRQEILGIAGGTLGVADFYETEEFDNVKSIPGFGTQSMPFFLGLHFDPKAERFLLFQNDPQFLLFDKNVNQLSAANLLQEHRPLRGFFSNGFVFVDEKNNTSPQHIFTQYTQQGLLLNSFSIDGDLKSVSHRSGDEFYVWIDGNNGLELRILNTANGLLSQAYERPNEMLRDVVSIGSGVFILSTDLALYRYNYNNGGTVIIDQNPGAEKLFYNDLEGLVYATTQNNVRILNGNGANAGSYTFTDPVVFIGFDYNR